MHFIGELRDLSGGKPTGFKLVHRPSVGVVRHRQGDAGDRHHARLHRRRRRRRRHRRGAARVHRPRRHAAAGRADASCTTRWSASACASAIRIGGARQDHHRASTSRACMALGADWCNAARGFMFALGCIQSQTLPHRPLPDRRGDAGPGAGSGAGRAGQGAARARNFHAARWRRWPSWSPRPGLDHPSEFRLEHFRRRVSAHEVRCFSDLYARLPIGALLHGTDDARFAPYWALADAHSFQPRQLALT